MSRNGYGFSVQTAPGRSPNELAAAAPNVTQYGSYRYNTVQQLESIPGVSVNFPTPGQGTYHGTVNVPNPPPPRLFAAISGQFITIPSPYRACVPDSAGRMEMLKLYTDFQAVDEGGACFILKRDQLDAEHYADEFSLSKGDRVLLDAHEDFEVSGTLDYRFVPVLGRETWVAYPDWSTRRLKEVG